MMNFYSINCNSVHCCTLFLIFFGGKNFVKSQSQDTLKSTLSYTLKSEFGSLMNTNVYVDNLPSKNYSASSFQITIHPKSKSNWESLYKNPTYGLGINYVDFINNQQMGHPFSFYGFFNNTINEWNQFSWDYYVNLGVSFNAKPYDQNTDYNNVSFGSKTNLYIGVGTMIKYTLNNHFDIGMGLGLNHFSNGSLKSPNKGLNFGAVQLMLVYHPEKDRLDNWNSKGTKFDKFETFEMSVLGGRKNVFYRGEGRETLPSMYEGFNYYIYGLEGLYIRQYNGKSAYGLGLGIIYDGNYNHTMYVENQFLKERNRFENTRYLISLLPTYRLIMGKVAVNIQAGYYPFKKVRKYDESRLFQKIGLQYQISNRIFASFGINAYDFHRANYLEWKLGYILLKSKVKS